MVGEGVHEQGRVGDGYLSAVASAGGKTRRLATATGTLLKKL